MITDGPVGRVGSTGEGLMLLPFFGRSRKSS